MSATRKLAAILAADVVGCELLSPACSPCSASHSPQRKKSTSPPKGVILHGMGTFQN